MTDKRIVMEGCPMDMTLQEVSDAFSGKYADQVVKVEVVLVVEEKPAVSTRVGNITSVQKVFVPADDLTDPSPATTFAHLDATIVLSR